MQRILIIHTAYIGDIILATPLIPAIKRNFPECLIDFITIPASRNLLECEDDINRLIIYDKRGEHKGFKGLKQIISYINSNYTPEQIVKLFSQLLGGLCPNGYIFSWVYKSVRKKY